MTEKQLSDALLKFGGHKAGCTRQQWTAYPCSCGWDKAEKLAMEIVFKKKGDK